MAPIIPLTPRIRAYLENPRSPASFYGLDGLRALAILLVLLHHGPKDFYVNDLYYPLPLLPDFLKPLVFNGRLGVDLFFVLSGFLITAQLLKVFERDNTWRAWPALWRYLANRAMRIIPAFYILLLIVQFIIPLWVPLDTLRLTLPDVEVSNVIWAQYAFMQDFFGRDFMPLFWTLGVEEKFYLLAPLLSGGVYFFSRKRPALMLGLLGLLVLIPTLVRSYYLWHYSPASVAAHYGAFRFTEFHMRGDGILVGMLCAFLYRYREDIPALGPLLSRERFPKLLQWVGLLAIVCFIGFLPLLGPYGDMNICFSGLGIALSFGIILLGTVLTPNERCGWLGSRPLFWIARVSYSLYLTHILWATIIQRVIVTQLNTTLSWPVSPWLISGLFLASMGLYLAMSLSLGTLYFYLFEKPFLLLKDQWFKKSSPLDTVVPLASPSTDAHTPNINRTAG